MTLKRYQPVRRRKRPSKKNRPLKMAVALGVVGVAVGLAYVSLHGEVLMGLLDGSVDLPDHHFRAAQPAAPHVAAAPTAHPRPAATPMATPKAAAKLAARVEPSIAPSAVPATPAAPSVAPMHSAVPTQPSAFPEGAKKPAHENLMAGATVLKPAGVASFQPAKTALKPTAAPIKVAKTVEPTPKPVAMAAQPATPAPKPSPKAEKPRVAARPSTAPTAKPVSAPRAVAAAAGRGGGSLYFDKNSSYLSSAEKDRLASLVDAIARKGGTIHVAGYADSVGDVSYSRWIAGRRANRVADLIRARAGGKVTVVVDDIDVVKGGADDAKNRRVELQVK